MAELSYNATIGTWWTGAVTINYSTSYDQAKNQTTVTFYESVHSYSGRSKWGSSASTALTVTAADNTDNSGNATFSTYGSTTGGTATFKGTPSPASIVVKHAATPGKKSVVITGSTTIKVYATTTATSQSTAKGSGSVTVEAGTAATPSTISAPDGYFGNVIPITISRQDASYTHTITASCAGVTETIISNSADYPTVNWIPDIDTYAPKIPNAMSANCVLTCSTYWNGLLAGSKSVSITLTLPEAAVKPSTVISVTDTAGYLAIYGKYVATKSKLKISLTDTLKYGASTKAVSITANGATYSTNPATTNELLSESYNAVKAKIQDSRSLWSDEAAVTLNILPYAPPSISSFSVHRCDADGSANDEGAYCRVDFKVSISPLDDINSRALAVKFKAVSAEEYTSDSINLSAYAVTDSYVFPADTEQSFDVRLELTDDFSTSTMQTILSTAAVIMAFRAGGHGVGFGKVPEHDYSVEIAANWTLRIGERTLLDYLHPVGSIYISSQSTDPDTQFGGTWTQVENTLALYMWERTS